MTRTTDTIGRAPIRKKKDEEAIGNFDGEPSIAELCKPLSAKVIPKRVLAMSDGYVGAMQAQRREGRRASKK
jgi:hypothetical protein